MIRCSSRSSAAVVAAAVCAVLLGSDAQAQVRITEFMSEGAGDTASGNGGRRQREFFELTNLGSVTVNTSGRSYNDNNVNDPLNFAGVINSIAPGESVIFTQMTPADFRGYWGLPLSIQVFSIGGLSNLGNADTINIYNSTVQDGSTLVDTLTYTADARGSGVSRNRPFDGATGPSLNPAWVISSIGDSYQSALAPSPTGFPPNFPQPTTGFNQSDYIDLANPGKYIPTPGAAITTGLAGIFAARRRRR